MSPSGRSVDGPEQPAPTRISDLLQPSLVTIDFAAAGKDDLLERMARQAASAAGIDAAAARDAIMARERLGSTAVGGGIAIPHGRIAGLSAPVAVFVRTATPVAFDAADNAPVDLLFLLLTATTAGAAHLRMLARISRLLRDPVLCQALRAAPDAATVLQRVAAAEARIEQQG
jgi:PTS system nitrogen regulatory IIA component